MKKITSTLSFLLSTLVFGQLTNNQKAEMPFKNYIANPGAEQLTRAWTGTDSTLASNTANVHSGLGSLAWNATAAAETLVSTLVAIPEGDGACLAEFYYKGFGTADIRIYIKDNSANVIAGYTAADTVWAISTAATSWTRVQVPFPCPSSGTVQLVLEAQGNAAIGYVDDAYLGRDFRIGVDKKITDWIGYTPTGAWSTNTTYTGFWRQVGDQMEVQAKIATAGVPTSATLTVNIPTGYTISTAKLVNGSGTAEALGIGAANDSGTSYKFTVFYSSTTAVLVGYQNSVTATATTVTQAAPFTFGAGDYVTINFSVPIVEFASQNTLRGDTTDLYGEVYTNGASSCQWLSTSATVAAFTADSDCAAPTASGNATAPATKIPAMIVPKILPGRYLIMATGVFKADSSASGTQTCPFSITDGTTVKATNGPGQIVNTYQDRIGEMSAVFEYTTAQTNRQFEIYVKRASGNASCAIDVNVATEMAFQMRIIPISQALPRPFIPGSVFAARPRVVKIGTAKVSCSSSSSITTNTDSMIVSIGNISSGSCAITLTTGYFSATPECFVTWTGVGNNAITYSSASSATATTVAAVTDAGVAATTFGAQIMCIGNN